MKFILTYIEPAFASAIYFPTVYEILLFLQSCILPQTAY